MKYIFVILSIFWMPQSILAQFDMQSHLSLDPSIRQSVYPSTVMDSTICITLPGIYSSNRYRGISYRDIVTNGSNISKIDAQQVIFNTLTDNHYQNYASFHGLSLHYTKSNMTISTGYNYKFIGFATYPQELIKLGLEGNTQYLDQEISIGPQFALRSYHEVYLGLAKKMGKISIGARFKILSGIEDLSTANSTINITTDSEYYQSHFDNHYTINSSGVLDYKGLNDFTVDFDPLRVAGLSDNLGYGVDLGIDIELSKNLSVSASILDIGKISWTKNKSNYTSNDKYDFEGLDLLQFIENSESINIQDSIYNILQFEETYNEYETKLPQRLNFAARYIVNDHADLGANLYYISHNGPNQWALALQYRRTIKQFSVLTQYAYINDSAVNIGLGMGLDLGWLQLTASSDNVLGLIDMLDSRATNYRLGASLHF